MSKHTVGPWEVVPHIISEYGDPGFCHFAILQTKGEGYQIATTIGDVDTLKDAEEANARLIAAAPELLEALKALDDWWSNSRYGNFRNPNSELSKGRLSPDTIAIWKQIRAAIDKAEGRL